MDSKRLYPVISGLKVSLVLIFLLLPGIPTLSSGGIAPNRTIVVVAEEPDVPGWKALWDDARNNVRVQQFDQAVILYGELFSLKPNIEEASWEYCKVLLNTEGYTAAAKIIVSLLEKNPSNIEYLLAAGLVSLKLEEYSLAIAHYGKVYETDPGGKNSTIALEGLVKSLKGRGQINIAFPLLQQLHIRVPGNKKLLHELAIDAEKLGKYSIAQGYYFELLTQNELDDRIVFQAAELFEKLGNLEDAAPQWNRYVQRNPHYYPFQQKLVNYYLQKNDGDSAIPFLIILADGTSNNAKFLLQIAEIYLHELGRPDKALIYYEKYLEKKPNDRIARENVSNIQSILANNFLSIVENDGAWLLWRDLAKLTPNRMAIYREMVSLLEEQKKYKELLEILLIIHGHDPEDNITTHKIIDIYTVNKIYTEALKYIGQITAPYNSTKNFFLQKGNLEERAGFEGKAIYSYRDALKLDRGDLQLSYKCIEMAGSLGLVAVLEEIFFGTLEGKQTVFDIDLALNYVNQLAFNGLFSKLESRYNELLHFFRNDADALFLLKIHREKSLRLDGKLKESEALLRLLLSNSGKDLEVLFELTNNAIDDRNIVVAQMWNNVFKDKIHSIDNSPQKSLYLTNQTFLEARLLLASGNLDDAMIFIKSMKTSNPQASIESFVKGDVSALELELCWLFLESGRFSECANVLTSLTNDTSFDPEVIALQIILDDKKITDKFNGSIKNKLFISKQPIASRLIKVAKVEISHKEYLLAEKHLKSALGSPESSLISSLLQADIFRNSGRSKEAMNVYKKLYAQYPTEKTLLQKIVQCEVKKGRYDLGLEFLVAGSQNIQQLESGKQISTSSTLDYTQVVSYARMLWGNKQLTRAIEIYEFLLFPPVTDILGVKFKEKDINYFELTREESFWTSLMLLLQSAPEIISELMSPSFLVDNIGNDAGEIVAGCYELYSWQKLIMNEYLARKAIVEKNYGAAKLSYRKVLEENESIEGLHELASIYDRFGEYRKEAQVYDVIQKSGMNSPYLQSSIEKSSSKIRPQTGIDGIYSHKKGRDGSVDLKQTSLGASLFFTPDLNKDFTVKYQRAYYQDTENTKSIWTALFETEGTLELFPEVEVPFSMAVENLNSGGTNSYYSIGLHSRLDDYFTAYFDTYKKKVDDSFDAIDEGIYSKGIEFGLVGETPIGILFGTEYWHQYYSDKNSQNKFHGWIGYNNYGEVGQLKIQYDYLYLENSENLDEKNEIDEPGLETDSYWKPEYYYQHSVSLQLQGVIDETLGVNGLKSYYSFDNSISYENDQNVLYTGKLDILLEMSQHYLLKGNFVFINSEEYEEKSALLSLHYRW